MEDSIKATKRHVRRKKLVDGTFTTVEGQHMDVEFGEARVSRKDLVLFF